MGDEIRRLEWDKLPKCCKSCKGQPGAVQMRFGSYSSAKTIPNVCQDGLLMTAILMQQCPEYNSIFEHGFLNQKYTDRYLMKEKE